jgi:shikimate dehydrogenase
VVELGGAPLRLGLLGDPVAHSLSPALHVAAGASVGLRVDYGLFQTDEAHLDARIAELCALGLRGFNATAPLKVALLTRVGALSPGAARVAAVNTVCIAPDGMAFGHNTDLVGYAARINASPTSGPAVVLGAGGAARAALVALAEAGVGPIWLAARRPEAAEALADALEISCALKSFQQIGDWLPAAGLAIGCLPEPALAAVEGFDWHRCRPDFRLLESGYTFRARACARAVRASGRRAEDGLPLLVAQGVAAFALFAGRAPDSVPVMAAVQAALARRDDHQPDPTSPRSSPHD